MLEVMISPGTPSLGCGCPRSRRFCETWEWHCSLNVFIRHRHPIRLFLFCLYASGSAPFLWRR